MLYGQFWPGIWTSTSAFDLENLKNFFLQKNHFEVIKCLAAYLKCPKNILSNWWTLLSIYGSHSGMVESESVVMGIASFPVPSSSQSLDNQVPFELTRRPFTNMGVWLSSAETTEGSNQLVVMGLHYLKFWHIDQKKLPDSFLTKCWKRLSLLIK